MQLNAFGTSSPLKRTSQLMAQAVIKDEETSNLRDKTIAAIIEWSRALECGNVPETERTQLAENIARTYLEWKNRSSNAKAARFRRRSTVTHVEMVLPTNVESLDDQLSAIASTIGMLIILKLNWTDNPFFKEVYTELLEEENLQPSQLPKFINGALVSALKAFWDNNAKLSKAHGANIEISLGVERDLKAQNSQIEESPIVKGVKWVELDEEQIAMREARNESLRRLTLPCPARSNMIAFFNSLFSIERELTDSDYEELQLLFEKWCNESQYIETPILLGPDRLAHKIAKLESKLTVNMCNLVVLLSHNKENTNSLAFVMLCDAMPTNQVAQSLLARNIAQFRSLVFNICNWKLKRNQVDQLLKRPDIVGEPQSFASTALIAAARCANE